MRTELNIEKIIDLVRRDDSIDAPADSVKWAKDLFRSRMTEPKASPLRRLVAILQAELSPNEPAFGERSASTSKVRQRLYAAGDAAIDLRLEGSGKEIRITGQILGEGFGNARVELKGENFSSAAAANELGEFKFENVSAGIYDLAVLANNAEIVIENIELA